jgi:hypothetical protein
MPKKTPQKRRRTKKGTKDQTDELMLAFLRNKGFEHTREYVQRGRELKDLPSRDLKERWVVAFRQMAVTLSRDDPPIRMDIESEFLRLRRLLFLPRLAGLSVPTCARWSQKSARNSRGRPRPDHSHLRLARHQTQAR